MKILEFIEFSFEFRLHLGSKLVTRWLWLLLLFSVLFCSMGQQVAQLIKLDRFLVHMRHSQLQYVISEYCCGECRQKHNSWLLQMYFPIQFSQLSVLNFVKLPDFVNDLYSIFTRHLEVK